MKLLWCGYLAR